MKRMLSLFILGLFLISCGAITPSSSPMTVVVPFNVTPIPTPSPVSLSPINAGNVDQIQTVYAIHVSDTERTEDVLAISTDKKWVALTPKNGAPLHVQRLKWTPDGSFVPMGNGFTSFYLYQTASVAFSPDSMHFALANQADNSVLVFGLDDLPNEAKKTVLPIGDRPEAVTFTKDSQKLIVGTQGGANDSLQLWDVGTASLERKISADAPGGLCSAAISPGGKTLAAGSCANPFDISTWDVGNNYTLLSQITSSDQAGSCTGPCPGQNNAFAFNPATGEIASGIDFPIITIHDPNTGKLSTSVTMHPAGDSSNGIDTVSALAYTSDGASLVMVANQELQLVDAKEGKLLWHPADPMSITAMTISADSKLLVTLDTAGDMIFWGVPAK